MNIAKFSVKNSLFINLVSVLILIIGVMMMFTLNREAFPVINFDEAAVSTVYPGASAEDVEKLVTTLLETELREVDEIDEIVSVSRESLSTISLKLDKDVEDIQKVIDNIQKAVDRVTDLPDAVEDRPVVIEINSKIFPIINIGLSGEIDEFELQNQADILKDIVEDVRGVAKVTRHGYRDQEFWVEPDLEKMKKLQVSIEDIIDSLRSRNITVPGGKLKTVQEEFTIKTTGEFTTKEEIEEVIVRANDAGNWLRVKDVAKVRHTFEEELLMIKNLGKKAILLEVFKKEKGDAINVVEGINQVLREFEKTKNVGVTVSTYDDFSYYVKRRLNVLCSNGLIGFILVVLILFAFLHVRPAFFTALGIPVAMCATLGLMFCLGLTINLMTMFGLVIVLGMIVDDGIIIAENVYRYVEAGMSPKEAAVKGTSEVIAPVMATIVTTIAAFFPLMYMSGIVGKFLRYIPLMVIVALSASVLEAFVILPSHLAGFLKKKEKNENDKEKNKQDVKAIIIFSLVSGIVAAAMAYSTNSNPLGVLALILLVGAFAIVIKKLPAIEFMIKHYKKMLEAALHNRYGIVGVITLIFIGSIMVIIFVLPQTMFSDKGAEEFLVRAEASVGTPLQKTNELLLPVEELIGGVSDKYIQSFVTTVGNIEAGRGMGDPNAKSGSNVAQIHVYLTPMQQRDKGPEEIMAELRPRLEKIPGFEKLYFFELKEGPPVGRDIEFNVRGEKYTVLLELSQQIKAYLAEFDGVSDITDSYNLGDREYRISVDRAKATKADLTVSQIAFSVRHAFEGGIATTIKQTNAEEEINVRVRLPESQRNSENIFKELFVQNKQGNLIPLNQIAKIEKTQSLRAITHLDGKRYIQVAAAVDKRKIKPKEMIAKIFEKFEVISRDYPGYTIRLGGEEKENQEIFASLMKALLIAVLAIFMILATLFSSLVQPFIVMLTIPFSLIGVVIALLVHGESLSILSFIGIVGLAGIVVNDSIVLMDFINKLRQQGVSRRDSIVQAGVVRFRPVILTTLTTVAGLSTVAYGIGGFDPFLQPMALAISWGLAFATGLTLIVMPCFYAIIDDITKKVTCHETVRKGGSSEDISS